MPKVTRDKNQPDVYYFEETPQEKEIREMKETLAELQEREKQRQKLTTKNIDFTTEAIDQTENEWFNGIEKKLTPEEIANVKIEEQQAYIDELTIMLGDALMGGAL